MDGRLFHKYFGGKKLELKMILKWRTGLKHQTGKCKEGNAQITENIWPDGWSAKTDLVFVAYCKLNIWNMWQKCSAVTKEKKRS